MRLHWNSKLRAGLCDSTTVLLGLLASLAIFIPQEASHAQVEETAETKQDVERQDIQEEAAQVEVAMRPWMGIEPALMMASKRFQLAQTFQVEIESIERLCELTPLQKTKLRIAAKKAEQKLTDEWWTTFGPAFGGAAVPLKQAGDQDEGRDEGQDEERADAFDKAAVEIKDFEEIDTSAIRFIVLDKTGNPYTILPAREEASWKNLKAGILTAEQLQALAEFQTAQKKQRRADVLDSVISVMTFELGLTDEQVASLRKILSPHFENAKLNCAPLFEVYVAFHYASKATNEELATLLSPAQIQKWRMFLLPARDIGSMLNVENN